MNIIEIAKTLFNKLKIFKIILYYKYIILNKMIENLMYINIDRMIKFNIMKKK